MTHSDTTVFLVDASVWIRLYDEIYPPDVFPALYRQLAALGAKGRFKSPRQAVNELGNPKSGVGAWVRTIQPSIIVAQTPRVAAHVKVITDTFPQLVGDFTGEQADPYLVAMGQEHGYVIVTEERRTLSSSAPTKPKIPDVCHAVGVKWISTLGWLRALRIQV